MQSINKILHLPLIFAFLSPSLLFAMNESDSSSSEEVAKITKKNAKIKISRRQYKGRQYEGSDSEESEDWEYKPKHYKKPKKLTGEVLIPFFRGAHLFSENFPQGTSQFLRESQVGKPIFPPCVFKELKLEYSHVDEKGHSLQDKDCKEHDQALATAKELKKKIKHLRSDEKLEKIGSTNTLPLYVDKYVSLHYHYVKNYNKFISNIEDFGFLGNPLVSTAEVPEPSLGYAYGLKTNKGQASRPHFDKEGKPENPYLGKFYIILLPLEKVKELFRVVESYAKIETLVNCFFKHAMEATFPGFIPGKYVVYEHIVRVPNFQHKWKEEHQLKYGLNKTTYTNRRKKIRATNGNFDKQEDIYEELVERINEDLVKKLIKRAKKEAATRGADMKYLDLQRSPVDAPPTIDQADKNIKIVKKLIEKTEAYDKQEDQYKLGLMYENGKMITKNETVKAVVARDETAALKWYKKAAKQEARAWYKAAQQEARTQNLEKMDKNGKGVTKDMRMGTPLYTRSANQEYARVEFDLALAYYDGEGVPQNYKMAVKWFKSVANRGVTIVQTLLGTLYANGKGVTKNNGRAVEWYKKAAGQNCATAQFNLGAMYENGEGVTKDEKEAIRLYTEAANQGHADARSALAWIYKKGSCGVTEDMKISFAWHEKAFESYKKAAEKGDVEAQFILGSMYKNGYGVTKDEREAIEWYKEAADGEHAAAQRMLGWIYKKGNCGEKQDGETSLKWYKKAFESYKKAADKEDVEAQFILGSMYKNGYGVPKNEKKAIELYQKAADQGNEKAKIALAKLKK
jgi:TPR repeat protein